MTDNGRVSTYDDIISRVRKSERLADARRAILEAYENAPPEMRRFLDMPLEELEPLKALAAGLKDKNGIKPYMSSKEAIQLAEQQLISLDNAGLKIVPKD